MNDEARSWFPVGKPGGNDDASPGRGRATGIDHGSNWGWSESAGQGPSPRGSSFPRARRHGNRVSKWWVSSIVRPDVRETGVVKSYFEAKGFGFIRARGVEYFFHISDVRAEEPKAIIRPGRAVKFEATQTAKGARAVDVVLL